MNEMSDIKGRGSRMRRLTLNKMTDLQMRELVLKME